MRILLIEDHQRLAQSVVEGLAGFGFGVDLFMNAEDGLAATKSISYDAIILDLGFTFHVAVNKSRQHIAPRWLWRGSLR
jgi:DNA-binding response OmpR family regulator